MLALDVQWTNNLASTIRFVEHSHNCVAMLFSIHLFFNREIDLEIKNGRKWKHVLTFVLLQIGKTVGWIRNQISP